jgi:hypothetical protein
VGRSFSNWGRAFVKLDRFAPLALAREHGLASHERSLLLTLTLLADFRSAEWLGTKSDLAQEAGMGRAKVSSVLDRLESCRLVEVLDEFGPNSPGRLLVLVYDLLVTDPVAEVRKRLEDRRSAFTCTSHLSLTASLPRHDAFTQVTGSDLHAATRVRRESDASPTRVRRESKRVEPSAEELPKELRCPFPGCGDLVVDNECFSMHESVLTTGTDGRLTRVPREWQTAEPSKYPIAELPKEFRCSFPGCPGLVMKGRCSLGHQSVMSTGGEGQPTRDVLADRGEGDSEPSPAERQAMYSSYVDFEDEEGEETFGMSSPKSAPSEAA